MSSRVVPDTASAVFAVERARSLTGRFTNMLVLMVIPTGGKGVHLRV